MLYEQSATSLTARTKEANAPYSIFPEECMQSKPAPVHFSFASGEGFVSITVVHGDILVIPNDKNRSIYTVQRTVDTGYFAF